MHLVFSLDCAITKSKSIFCEKYEVVIKWYEKNYQKWFFYIPSDNNQSKYRRIQHLKKLSIIVWFDYIFVNFMFCFYSSADWWIVNFTMERLWKRNAELFILNSNFSISNSRGKDNISEIHAWFLSKRNNVT